MSDPGTIRKRITLLIVVLLIAAAGIGAWYNLSREVDQPAWIAATARDRFLYGSTGAERTAGMPYWIWLVLPRIFPEYLPYPGGYVAVGMTWEEGREMPAGFSKKTVGYVRVAANCALCHARSYRSSPDAAPQVVQAVPGHTVDLQPLLTFLNRCAEDPRFNADELLGEIDMATDLPFVDRLLYRFVLIPRTRQALIDQTVLLDSSLQAHRQNPGTPFVDPRLKPLEEQVRALRAPAYPLPVNAALAAAGRAVFAQHCASCHAIAPGEKTTEKVYTISEIGTDRALLDGWANHPAALGDAARQAAVKSGGYVAPPLAGIWLRGPYLHNGSVRSVRELLEAPAQRGSSFFPGSDIVDAANLGFLSAMEEEPGRQRFTRYDTSLPGHSNAGHLYATGLSRTDKDALIEYLKGL